MILNIGKKDYNIEFNIEASLNRECVDQITEFMCGLNRAESKNPIQAILDSVKDKPKTVLAMFYAGLLENHGEDGDGTITSKADAKKLLKQYFTEHKEDGAGNYYALYTLLLGQMEDDGFFALIGLEQTMNDITEFVKKIQEAQTKNKTSKKQHQKAINN